MDSAGSHGKPCHFYFLVMKKEMGLTLCEEQFSLVRIWLHSLSCYLQNRFCGNFSAIWYGILVVGNWRYMPVARCAELILKAAVSNKDIWEAWISRHAWHTSTAQCMLYWRSICPTSHICSKCWFFHNSMHGITSSWHHRLHSRKMTLWECSEFVEHKSLCASSTSMLPTFAIHGQSSYLYQVKHIRFTATCVGWFIWPWVCICLLQEQQLHYYKHMHWAHPTNYVTDRHWLQGPFLLHFVANTSNPWAAFAPHCTSPKIMAAHPLCQAPISLCILYASISLCIL